MKRGIWFVAGLLSWAILLTFIYTAKAQQPQLTCEEKLDEARFQAGGLMQQVAVLTSQLRTLTKELTDLKVTKVPEKK